jgi:lysine 2,3-aminomutase
MSTRYFNSIHKSPLIEILDPDQVSKLESVERVYPFRSNEYYLSLINYNSPNDPIKRIILPDPQELAITGTLDPSGEEGYTPIPGVQHKYPQTALLLVSNTCAGICRFCFRKRLFTGENPPPTCDMKKAIDYLQAQPDLTDVLLSGGDPLMLDASKLDQILCKVRELPTKPIIRIGTKVPAYDPHRITDNSDLCDVLAKHATPEEKIYLISHFNHPHEVTDSSKSAISALKKTGVELTNQTPILDGVNNNPEVMASLFKMLAKIGVPPYYVFQCRPTSGNRHLTVPIEQAMHVIHEAQACCSGLAKRARYIMSHKSGKIEIVGKTSKHIFMKYHQAASLSDLNSMLVFKPNPRARWLEDYHQRLTDMVPKMTWLF